MSEQGEHMREEVKYTREHGEYMKKNKVIYERTWLNISEYMVNT